MYPENNSSNSQVANLAGTLFNKRRFAPWYDDRADYNTDAKSYYDYLARNGKLMDAIIEVINNLSKEQPDNEDLIKYDYEPYINGIKTHHGRLYDTTYTMIEVPQTDSSGNKIILKRGLASDSDNAVVNVQTGYDWNANHFATVFSNASTAKQINGKSWHLRGHQIHNGKNINGLVNEKSANRWSLAWGDDGKLKSFPPDISADDLISNYQIKEALTGFYPIYMNGELQSDIWDQTGKDPNPRTAIFQRANGNLIFYSNDGRLGTTNVGMTLAQVYEAVTSQYTDIVFGYNLDGGGSSQLYEYGYNHTRPYDAVGHRTRGVGDFVYIGHEPDNQRDKNTQHVMDMIATLREKQTDNEADFRNFDTRRTGYLQLGGANDTDGRGIYTRTADGELANALWLNPGGLLEWYDRDMRKDILELDKNEIVYMGERWGHNMNRYIKTQNEEPIPNESPTGGYFVTTANPDNPFEHNAVIYLQNVNNSTMIETITELFGGMATKRRFKTGGGDWSEWK